MPQSETTAQDEASEAAVGANGGGPTSPTHGALLFPELIWRHFCWQQALHPERFGKSRDVAGSRAEDDARLYQAYREKLTEFERSAGAILDAYWCLTDASAVVLTEKSTSLWQRLRGKKDLRLYRATDWVTGDIPRIAALLHLSDALAIKANQILAPVPKRITLNWIFSEQSFLLGVIERAAGRPRDKDLDAVVAAHAEELKLIERYYNRAASKSSRMVYFSGMLVGLVVLAALGAGVPGVLDLFTDLDLRSSATQNFFAAYGAGAVGAVISVMLRMRPDPGKGFSVDYEVGRAPLFWLGAFRPAIGAVFGTVVYFAVESGFLQFGNLADTRTFFFVAFLGFLAGFSERFTHVIFGEAELTVAQALGGGPPGPSPGNGTSGQADGDAPAVTEEPRRGEARHGESA